MYFFKRRRNPKQKKRLRRLFAVLIILFILVFLLDSRLRPVIGAVSKSETKALSVKIINAAVEKELARQDVTYSGLVTVAKDDAGKVVSITTDTAKINTLKAAITAGIQEELSAAVIRSIKIPVGTVIGSKFLSGRGPNLHIKFNLAGNIAADISSSFESAGINQTKHKMSLELTANISILIPGYNTSVEVPTSFFVAETIIVGDVPDAYTDIHGDESPIVSKINDYGAGQMMAEK